MSCQRVINGRRVGRDVGMRCRVGTMSLATSCDRERKRVGSGWRKTSFVRRRCGRETGWRERKRKAGGSRKWKGFPLQIESNVRIHTYEENEWNIRGRYETALEDDEDISWTIIDRTRVLPLWLVSNF